MKRFIIIIALATHFHFALGEEGPNNPITTAFNLIEKGRYDTAISMLTPVTESPSTANVDRGRALTVLGFAYKENSQFQQARHCYEQALSIFAASADFDADRAATLDYFGDLEAELGSLPNAQLFFTKALEIDERLQNHFRTSTVFINLAEISIKQKRYKDAKKYLESATQQAILVADPKPHLLADLYGTKGWLASETKQKEAAIEDFRQSLKASIDQFGSQHPITGWTYLLLGKAIADKGDLEQGMKNIRDGLAILESTAGTNDLKYLVGELVYSELLDRTGAHAESARIAAVAKPALAAKLQSQCANCTVSAWGMQK
jgi:tetratricopeptide (TPR) repeat protein